MRHRRYWATSCARSCCWFWLPWLCYLFQRKKLSSEMLSHKTRPLVRSSRAVLELGRTRSLSRRLPALKPERLCLARNQSRQMKSHLRACLTFGMKTRSRTMADLKSSITTMNLLLLKRNGHRFQDSTLTKKVFSSTNWLLMTVTLLRFVKVLTRLCSR